MHRNNYLFKNREPQWSSDETFYGILKGGNVLLYENNFDRYVHKIGKGNIVKFSIAPGNAPYHILCYMPGIYTIYTIVQY